MKREIFRRRLKWSRNVTRRQLEGDGLSLVEVVMLGSKASPQQAHLFGKTRLHILRPHQNQRRDSHRTSWETKDGKNLDLFAASGVQKGK